MEETLAHITVQLHRGCESRYNLINGLDANLRKVVGLHGKLLYKETQQDFVLGERGLSNIT